MAVAKIEVSKIIEELQGIEDVLAEPRSWTPDDLKQVCMNVDFKCDHELGALERATVVFLIREVFFLVHQTGLYNLQREMWSTIARTRKVKVTSVNNPFWVGKEKYKLTDIDLLDESTGKFIKARLVHEGAAVDVPGFKDFLSKGSSKCTGLFYISPYEFPEKMMKKVLKKTNHNDSIDRYRSPIGKNGSLNLINYRELQESKEFEYFLVHPNLGRRVSSSVCLNQ